MLHTRLTPKQFILLTIEDDTEEAPWLMMGDAQMWATSAFYLGLKHYGRRHPEWYVAGVLPILYLRPGTQVKGQLAPDAFVAFAEDRPRKSYDLAVEANPPAFVLEVLSPESVARVVELKRAAYNELGAQEYAIFEPTPQLGQPPLQGFRRITDSCDFVAWETDDGGGLHSEVLGLWLVPQGSELRAQVSDGGWLPTYDELEDDLEREAAARLDLEADVARLRANLCR